MCNREWTGDFFDETTDLIYPTMKNYTFDESSSSLSSVSGEDREKVEPGKKIPSSSLKEKMKKAITVSPVEKQKKKKRKTPDTEFRTVKKSFSNQSKKKQISTGKKMKD